MNSSNIETEFNEIECRNGWMNVFQSIKEKCDKEAKDKIFTLNESKQIENRNYNRYRDVNPYDHSRIKLSRGDTDYINANLVKLDRAQRKYILTQGPLQQTVGHFWLMIWEQKSKAILMLNKLIEKKQIKCHKYWPNNIGEAHTMNLTDIGLAVEYLKIDEFVNFSRRTFRLTDIQTKESREIIQFHYTTWPDFGIPTSPVAFLQFLKEVRESGVLDANVGPPIVHCSAGIGRSGTFCLVDCCLVLIENDGEEKVSVQEILIELRRYRMGLIQTIDQLYFSYQAIIEGIKRLNDPNHNDDYEEVPVTSHDDGDIEDTPPPLPPPRTHSLTPIGSKPLPIIPTSESLHDEIMSNFESEKINNAVNLEKNNYESNNIDRPLPPIPKDNSLEKVEESASDEDEVNIDDNYDDNKRVDSDEEKIDDVGDSDSDIEKEFIDNSTEFDPSNVLPPTPNFENHIKSNGPTLNENDCSSSPDNEKPPTSPSELRRRKRLERNSLLEEKVLQIKRKQKISDEKSNTSPKKRRTISEVEMSE